MLNLHRDKKIVRREPGRDGKILCDHRQDGNDEDHRHIYSICRPGSSEVPRNPLTRWDVSSIPANGIFSLKN